MIKTVLFDLDDTLFDHQYCRRCALRVLKKKDGRLKNVPLKQLEEEHELLLSGNYLNVLNHKTTTGDSRLRRIFALFRQFGIDLSDEEAVNYTDLYRRAYESKKRAVPKAAELLKALKEKKALIGVVSNGFNDIQMEKIKICRLDGWVDFFVFSEDIKVRKPAREIYEAALQMGGAKPHEAVFIGDLWETDIAGAAGCGIKAVWLNRYGRTCPDQGMAYEIHDYNDINAILTLIFME